MFPSKTQIRHYGKVYEGSLYFIIKEILSDERVAKNLIREKVIKNHIAICFTHSHAHKHARTHKHQ